MPVRFQDTEVSLVQGCGPLSSVQRQKSSKSRASRTSHSESPRLTAKSITPLQSQGCRKSDAYQSYSEMKERPLIAVFLGNKGEGPTWRRRC